MRVTKRNLTLYMSRSFAGISLLNCAAARTTWVQYLQMAVRLKANYSMTIIYFVPIFQTENKSIIQQCSCNLTPTLCGMITLSALNYSTQHILPNHCHGPRDLQLIFDPFYSADIPLESSEATSCGLKETWRLMDHVGKTTLVYPSPLN